MAAEVTRLLVTSGMSRAEFVSAIGTSVSGLSTYLSGKVSPSAALLVRMRRVATRRMRVTASRDQHRGGCLRPPQ